MSDISNAIDLIFQERREFIIIGITGRTGAGCSLAANLLCETFSSLGGADIKLDSADVLKGAIQSVFREPEKTCPKTI